MTARTTKQLLKDAEWYKGTGIYKYKGNILKAAGLIREQSAKLQESETKANKLWQLLDDIDTLDDAAKDNDKNFRDACYKIQQRRWDYIV